MYWTYKLTYDIPEGFELVEKTEHRKERLKSEKDTLKLRIKLFEDKLIEAEKELKTVEEELDKLK